LPLYASENTRPSEIRDDLEENLRSCSAILIIYGERPKTWVRQQLLQCHRIENKREQPLKVISLCVKPPSEEKLKLNMNFYDLLTLKCDNAQIESALLPFIQALQA
jgi:hypothetical protein